MKKIIYIAASVLYCLNAQAQYNNKQSVTDFNAIEVRAASHVELMQGDSNYVTLNSKDSVVKTPKIDVSGGVLEINSAFHRGRMIVHVKNIKSIRVSEAAKVTCIDTLTVDNLTIHVSDAGSAEIMVHAKSLDVRGSDASYIKLSGSADMMYTKATDASHIDAANLRSLHVSAASSDGSLVGVYAINSLDANATDGSTVNVRGTPAQKSTSASDGGSVSMGGTGEKSEANNSVGKKGFNIDRDAFIGMGFVTGATKSGDADNGTWFPGANAPVKYGASREFILGFGHAYNLAKWNALGLDVYYKSTDFYLNQDSAKNFPNKILHQAEKLSFQNLGGLIYDRFYIGRKIFLDGGVYGDWTFHSKHITWDENTPNASSTKTIERNFSYVSSANYGLTVRFGMTKGLSLYFNYRLSNLFKQIEYSVGAPTPWYLNYPELPAYTVGITLGSF